MATPFDFPPFQAHPWLGGQHLQTVFGTLFPRRFKWAGAWQRAARPVEYVMADGDRLSGILHCHPDDPERRRPLVVVLSGLEGHVGAHYMQGISAKAFAAGYHSLRLNYRTCGGTEHLARRMYNAAAIGDIDSVVRQLGNDGDWPIVLVGVSLGGNKVLRLLGTYGDSPPEGLLGGVAISPAIDLTASQQALRQGFNRVYDAYFLRSLQRRVRRKLALGRDEPGIEALYRQALTARNVGDFDEWLTAPLGGYADANDYYRQASAGDLIGAIRLPALILHAQDDPFVSIAAFEQRAALVAANPCLTTRFTDKGGHVGFVQGAEAPRPVAWMDAYWAENAAIAYVQWLEATVAPSPASLDQAITGKS